MLKQGNRVNTIYGEGIVMGVPPEIISTRIKRYCVHLDSIPAQFIDMDKKNGGIMFFENELEIKST